MSKNTLNRNAITQAILWAASMIASALILHDSSDQQSMLLLLAVLSTTSILLASRSGEDNACNLHWFKRKNKITN